MTQLTLDFSEQLELELNDPLEPVYDAWIDNQLDLEYGRIDCENSYNGKGL